MSDLSILKRLVEAGHDPQVHSRLSRVNSLDDIPEDAELVLVVKGGLQLLTDALYG